MRRTIYLVAFAVLAILAGLLTLRAQRTVAVLVAAHDVRSGAQLAGSDVEVRRVHEDSVPAGALVSPDDAVGQYVAWPLTAGEPVLARMLRRARSGISLAADLTVPDGYRAIALPVQPAGAVGGMLQPGDHVDVYATPLPGHTDSEAAAPSTAVAGRRTVAINSSPPDSAPPDGTVILGADLLVLQMRSDQGQALDSGSDGSVHGLDFGAGKLGSVVLAVPAGDVARYAAAAAGDSIYLALSIN